MQEPPWYQSAILYELHVRSFCDANGDGIGDFQGLTGKLDYLQQLGVSAVWLLPFYPSPLKDDGYDISDYLNVHPSYGTLEDFQVFLREAHRRGLKVVTELVLNHTSDQHPWFERARAAARGSPEREFYVWSDTPTQYPQARVIFKDFESSNWSWDEAAGQHYWHRFYRHQPDLNYDSPEVRKAILEVADFWLGMGVDGLRLDAVPYLFEREGTDCENLPESHAFLKELRAHVDARFKDRMLLAEANQWPEDAIAYFGGGDECHMAFHFPLMPRLFMGIRMEDRFPIWDILQQTPPIPEGCQWALFLRNHDELTLEMVTDEDRDYMVRVYAQDRRAQINLGIRRRLAPLLGNHRRKIELMNGLLFSLPGTPILYYGDEIGMGDNVRLRDRSGVRTPMQWSPGRNAGFSRALSARLVLPVISDPEYHYEVVNVEVQEKNPHSLLWQMRRLVAMRKQALAFAHGTLEFLEPQNPKILAFLRRYREEAVLVVANLSRFVQYAELDLSAVRGLVPVEMFGATRFPVVGQSPYTLTLGPHIFYWFTLEKQRDPLQVAAEGDLPTLRVGKDWRELLQRDGVSPLERILPSYLRKCRWFGGKGRGPKAARVTEMIPIGPAPGLDRGRGQGLDRGPDPAEAFLCFVEVRYNEGEPEVYLLPVGFQAGAEAPSPDRMPYGPIARVIAGDGEPQVLGVLHDALGGEPFRQQLLEQIAGRRRIEGRSGEMSGHPLASGRRGPPVRAGGRHLAAPAESSLVKAEQSNTSVVYGDQWILKLFRRVEQGVNPELEIGRFLTEKASFPHLPAVAGYLEYRADSGEPVTVGVLHQFVRNEGDGWGHTLDVLGQYFEEALARGPEQKAPPCPPQDLLELAGQELPPLAREVVGPYLETASLLGERTAQMHLALSSGEDDPAFQPEPFSELYQRSIYERMRASAARALQMLRRMEPALPPEVREEAGQLLQKEKGLLKMLHGVLGPRIRAMRIRCHGDYHLGQLLYTGKDFLVMDFEGEPARALSERRIKRSPLRDVAGMLRSFQYAAYAVLLARDAGSPVRAEDVPRLEPWARYWVCWVSVAFLKAYFGACGPAPGSDRGQAPFLPEKREEMRALLNALLLEKAVYEVGYELNHRPEWLRIPLKGILQLLETAG
ncbi:MAG: maltose alpha-D-glucosyltransferase [Candidatus Omnitrophica bacterium]|nr:maltose alpha-D-glucosyltransferase [Candidatus Omnitrophota bacterium]